VQNKVERITRLVSRDCDPDGVFDPWYEGCA
jgi:hypothetical protein